MLLQNVAKKYPSNYVILSPAKRDDDGRVHDWQVLNNGRNYQKIKKLVDYYRREGIYGKAVCGRVMLTASGVKEKRLHLL